MPAVLLLATRVDLPDSSGSGFGRKQEWEQWLPDPEEDPDPEQDRKKIQSLDRAEFALRRLELQLALEDGSGGFAEDLPNTRVSSYYIAFIY
jgi:hypothetical protein